MRRIINIAKEEFKVINDLDLSNWKELDILTEDLWLFANRDKSGKHKNV